MKEMEQLDDFCMKLYGIVTNIRVLGETMEETYVVKKLLRAVPSKYMQIASTIEQFGNLEEMAVEETVEHLKAHEERLCGQNEGKDNQFLLTKEDWMKSEAHEGQLLLTRDEWMKRANKRGTEVSPNQKGRHDNDYHGRDNSRGGRDGRKVKCFS